jgi:hypothetical protein
MNEETLKTAKKISADLAEAYKALGIWAEITEETIFRYDNDTHACMHSYYPPLPGIDKNALHMLKAHVTQNLEAEIANCKELIRQL